MKNLLQDNLEGDVTFKKIFVTYYARIVYFAFQIIGDREEAEDIAQDVFLQLIKSNKEFENEENVSQHEIAIKNYLYLTAKNLCLNQIRHNNVVKEYQAKNQFPVFDDTDIVNAIVSSEISSRIYRAIETLPSQCREVTRMAYIQGLKNQEIADDLQISINSVRAHKQRAIQLLRDKLDKKDLLLMIIFEKKLNFL